MMAVIPDNAQHIGRRSEQQDSFGFSDLEQTVFVQHGGALGMVADGMGGLEGGRKMSQLASRLMIEAYSEKDPAESIPEALRRALHTANRAVLEGARQLGREGDAGTTLAAAVVHENSLYWISVGDSRIYLYRNATLTQLTVDHGYARHLARKVAAGEISEATAATHPERHAITSFLGLDILEEIDQSRKPFPLQPEDRVLICSDGLYGALSESEIIRTLGERATGAARALIDAALSKGYRNQDNVTAALLDCPPVGTSFGATDVQGPRPGRRSPRIAERLAGWPVRVAAALLLALALGGVVALTVDPPLLSHLGILGAQASETARGVVVKAKLLLQKASTSEPDSLREAPARNKDTIADAVQDTTREPAAGPSAPPETPAFSNDAP